MKLIDKFALVAELEKRTDELYDLLPNASKVENGTITISEACNTGKYTALESFRKYIDTLEIKEGDVDLKKEYDNVFFKDPVFRKLVNRNAGIGIAKHFYELGLRVQI